MEIRPLLTKEGLFFLTLGSMNAKSPGHSGTTRMGLESLWRQKSHNEDLLGTPGVHCDGVNPSIETI